MIATFNLHSTLYSIFKHLVIKVVLFSFHLLLFHCLILCGWLQKDEDATQPDVTLEEPGKRSVFCVSNSIVVIAFYSALFIAVNINVLCCSVEYLCVHSSYNTGALPICTGWAKLYK